ncbi:aspartate/glutamate racemase family protein [Frankia sp. RB7]|nr:aspartate/glutamate racemase family protein [Frankia sp. RB7]
MQQILLINPNSSIATTEMMVSIAGSCAGGGVRVVGATAQRSPPMITTVEALAASAAEVVEIGVGNHEDYAGIIVSAYGDPGLEALRDKVTIPVVGICEASMIEAAAGGRRFGVATVTPELADLIEDRARELDLHHLYSGIRLTPGDPLELVRDPARLERELIVAVRACFEQDGAEAVIIGGGPLGQVAAAIQPLFDQPIIAPIPAATRQLLGLLKTSDD